jgi:phosphoserine phosphatase
MPAFEKSRCSARTLLRKARTARLVFLNAHTLTRNDDKETAIVNILTAGIQEIAERLQQILALDHVHLHFDCVLGHRNY